MLIYLFCWGTSKPGSFDILGSFEFVPGMLNSCIQGHPSSRVRRKVYEFSGLFPDTIKFELDCRGNIWESLFNNHILGKEDIGLYFFASEKERKWYFFPSCISKSKTIISAFITLQKNHTTIEIHYDKYLFEVFRCLPSGQETSVCACVSKRWLILLRNIPKDDIEKSNGYLARSLVNRKSTDVRLTAIAIGTANRGGLAKLSIQGNNICRGVTDICLKDIARGCHLN
ncbi:hypothetical protein KY290_000538 [Solanum tuberosum]|uniref:AIPP2-like SPOC-like domain-containing protein n=1 Tax=Solanum tuberosum TaxID=4113 RepID=A0ABQ7WJL9_SOLTU|nr:hypothetical protein KY289_000594 [Solanum tuberosum]KAH0780940.1 hypothetical protein KY290_000538 [Solanum tuberosum]